VADHLDSPRRQEAGCRARRCASDAVDAIDSALAELHEVRQRLISEIRACRLASSGWTSDTSAVFAGLAFFLTKVQLLSACRF